jgi:peptidoglycan-associated lipoprotein
MNQTHRTHSIIQLGGALLLALGCASTPPADSQPAAPDPTPVTSPDHSAQLSMAGRGAPELAPVYFDTDEALLRVDARQALKAHAQAIQRHPEWGVVTIEGHCDERGSQEYNLALGGRRAAAVVRYLTDLGVPESRLETRSFGEEHPAVAGHDESAWQKNRRSELHSESYDAASR